MGIPAFFRDIISGNSESHFAFYDMKKKVDNFYIDFNAMIYNSLGTFYTEYENLNDLTNIQIENRIIKIVLNDLLHLINDIVKPTKLVYIAFDGPAPRAKMIQQRARRFKSIDENIFVSNLKKKLNIPINKKWDTTNISPGTKFMYKISNEIKKKIKNKYFNNINKNLKIILSDSQVPGEGEHKFIPEIKKQIKKLVNCIYSPDADLIVLALSTHKENIFIVREPKGSNIEKEKYKNTEFIYLSIDVTRQAFLVKLNGNKKVSGNSEVNKNLINDFVFLTLLCGNDFIIPPNYMLVRNKGLNMVLLKYTQIFQSEKKFLISFNDANQPIINMDFFKKLILSISENELKSYQFYQRNRDKIRKGIRNYRVIESEKDKSEYEVTLSRFDHEAYYSKVNPFYGKYNKEFDKINYYSDVWKEEYYKYFFNINKNDNIEEYKKKISKEFMKAIIWNLYYYFNNIPPSWRWNYPFRISPVLSDFYNYIKDFQNMNEFSDFSEDQPLKPFEQLLLILPPQKKNILPPKYGNLMVNIKSNLIQYYPISFNLDIVIGVKRVYSEPILPEIDLDFLLNETKKIKLSANDEKRNKIGTIFE